MVMNNWYRRLSAKHPRVWLPLLLLLLIPLAWAFQYQAASPGYQYQFPRDHASHPNFKTEWWYYTGHLQTTDGKRYGYELTFFRIGNELIQNTGENLRKQGPWTTKNLYAAHFALSDVNNKQFFYSEKLNRTGLNVAGARNDTYYVWNELWLAELLGNQMVIRADSPDGKQEIHLLLSTEKAPVVHGKNGISQKASCPGCASHYYSMTRLKTEGMLILNGVAQPVTGVSWMDHEFGSNQLAENQRGWDWFSIQLNDRTEVMLYLLRQDDGQIDPNSSGTIIDADGKSRHLTLNDFKVETTGATWTSPASKGKYPMGWHITIPSEDLSLNVTPSFENQELYTPGSTGVSYWEGSSSVAGRKRGQPVSGQAYVEMTGYAAQSVKGKL